jgi:hypothetical protein
LPNSRLSGRLFTFIPSPYQFPIPSRNKSDITTVFEGTKGEEAMSDKLIKTAICLALFISLFACSSLSSPSAPVPSAAAMEQEEQAIYAFFLPQDGLALILEGTSSGLSTDTPQESADYIKSSLTDISRQTLDSFVERNQDSHPISQNMDLGIEYKILTYEELKKISSQSNWGEKLSEAYPGSHGYLIFSRVGFNNTLDQAVIYVGSVGGPLMGSGSYFLMEKQNGEWIMKDEVMSWIS